MKQIQLTRGHYTEVDDADYEWLTELGSWSYTTVGYPVIRKLGAVFYMHHFLVGKPLDGYVVDHIDCNRLNNQRANLRIVTHSQSSRNKRRYHRIGSGQTSTYKGIVQLPSGKWRATISLDKKQKHLGCFVKDVEAALAYDRAAFGLHGHMTFLNFVGL